jgi:predicted RNA-binding protein with PUA domain
MPFGVKPLARAFGEYRRIDNGIADGIANGIANVIANGITNYIAIGIVIDVTNEFFGPY